MKTIKLHARYWKSNYPEIADQIKFDPNRLGLELVSAMVNLSTEPHFRFDGISLIGVTVNRHRGNDLGHQIHVTATRQQWKAVKKYLEEMKALDLMT